MRRSRHAVAVALALASCILFAAPPASAACAPTTEEQSLAAAEVVFEGIVLEGPLTPATFEVVTYLKGSGLSIVKVATGMGSGWVMSEGIVPLPGEHWRIYGRWGSEGTIGTSVCENSHRIAHAGARDPRAALYPRFESDILGSGVEAVPSDGLPFTGLDFGLAALAGLGAVSAGLVLRRSGGRVSSQSHG